MDKVDLIFTFYDKWIASFTPTNQAIISLALLIFLIWQIYLVVKRGHWIFIVLLVVFLPGTWPATKQIGELLFQIMLFLWEKGKGIL